MYERKDPWTVGAWMTQNPRTITSETSVRNAFITMRTEGFRHLLVCDDRRLVGIVTDRDLRRPDVSTEPEGWLDYYNLDEDYEVRFVMTTDVQALRPSDSLSKAVSTFIERKFGAVPVVDKHGDVLGILTTHDLLRAYRQSIDELVSK